MINGIFSTYSGKFASQRRLEIVSNNLANALTPGFKASRLVYNGTTLEGPVDQGQLDQTYVNFNDSYVHFSDAPIVETGNPFDMAIEGSGLFVVSTRTGIMYTRNGQFTLSSDKKLVTMDGNPVMGEGGADITIDGKDVKIEADGSVYVDGQRIDRIKVVEFADTKDLRNVGRSLFANANSGNTESPASKFAIKQASYEASNVDVMKEMVELINAMRAYESYSKVDQSVDETLSKLIDMGRL
jgi:flagellar basal-body rod protein FlgF